MVESAGKKNQIQTTTYTTHGLDMTEAQAQNYLEALREIAHGTTHATAQDKVYAIWALTALHFPPEAR